MSHFAVLIIGDNPEQQLAPFQENNMGNCPGEYLAFEAIDLAEEYEGDKAAAIADGYKEHEGASGDWENPNAKWHWHLLGGRWTGFFCVHSPGLAQTGEPGIMTAIALPGRADSTTVGNIDWEATWQSNRIRAQISWDAAQKENPKHRKFIYGIEEGDTHADFLDKHTRVSTFAVLHNGQWYERGKMGWFGFVADEKDGGEWQEQWDQLVMSLPKTTKVSVYDCHI